MLKHEAGKNKPFVDNNTIIIWLKNGITTEECFSLFQNKNQKKISVSVELTNAVLPIFFIKIKILSSPPPSNLVNCTFFLLSVSDTGQESVTCLPLVHSNVHFHLRRSLHVHIAVPGDTSLKHTHTSSNDNACPSSIRKHSVVFVTQSCGCRPKWQLYHGNSTLLTQSEDADTTASRCKHISFISSELQTHTSDPAHRVIHITEYQRGHHFVLEPPEKGK